MLWHAVNASDVRLCKRSSDSLPRNLEVLSATLKGDVNPELVVIVKNNARHASVTFTHQTVLAELNLTTSVSDLNTLGMKVRFL